MELHDLFKGYRHPFIFGVDYLWGVGDFPRTLTELAMCQFSANLRRMPRWWSQYQDPDIREIWAKDARERVWKISTPSAYAEIQLSPKQVDYVLDELAGYAALLDHRNGCQVSCFERIWESNAFTNSSILNKELSPLRTMALTAPGPNKVFTSLIDPFLYCLVYNKTLVSDLDSQQLRPVLPPASGDVYTVSPHFAFLPSDVSISPSGVAKFTSYINNLHPQYTKLYTQLDATLTSFVPMFEHTLTDLHRNNPLVQRILGSCKYTIWDEPEEPEFSDDEEGWTTYERELRYWIMNRPIQLPDVPDTGYSGGLEQRKHVVNLRGRNVQVITEVSEIQLPGGPAYIGSPWHVKGMRNERIVACGLYFTSIENITATELQFRMAVTCPRGFAAGDTGATLRTWGLRDGDACHQYIGTRPIHAGLALVFPNIYQHRQTGFTLANLERVGHQTTVSFWLVDPEVQPVVSTARVAPQQKAWIRNAVDEALDRRVPVEIFEKIMDSVEGLMEVTEAEGYKRQLLKEREIFREGNDNHHFCIPFDIWSTQEFPH